MKTNPVYKRECMVSARSFRLALVLLVFNGILALVALLNMYSALAQVRLTAEVQYTGFLDLYMFVASLEFLMLILIMPALTAGSISGERERQTLDLMLTTCMTPADIVLGKLEAALGTMFLMVVSSLPILAMVFVYGGVAISDLILLVCCFFAAAMFMGSIGLCCSALFRRTTAATVAAYVVTAVLTAGTCGINYLVTYINQMRIGEYLASAEAGGVSGGRSRCAVCWPSPCWRCGRPVCCPSQGRRPTPPRPAASPAPSRTRPPRLPSRPSRTRLPARPPRSLPRSRTPPGT